MSSSLKEAIYRQREHLAALLSKSMRTLAKNSATQLHNRTALEKILQQALTEIRCKHLYIMDQNGIQLTDNVTDDGLDEAHFGRDRLDRPYMQDIIGSTDFKLSEAYISRNNKRPSLTAIQVIRDAEQQHIGFLGADYDLRELPGTEEIYQESHDWRQIKGDPAIRGGLFAQQRAESAMDGNLDTILPLMNELMVNHGVFHCKLHFSSSRATIWALDSPYAYRLLNFDELIDPDTCLAYPRRPYLQQSIVAPNEILPILEMGQQLRFADETVYLRSLSLNLCNGMVALNFSCDGTHYLRFDEFLKRGLNFWFGELF
ncbi:MAG: PDC sensor domain-containing protein [Gammaproteobacteria bacterium]|nr:PDC sensor domain-containing protein [Gammaproteobacteria bacterium]